MKKENISTQTLLEVMLQEMEQVKAYTHIIKQIGPQLNAYLQQIQKQEIKVDSSKLETIVQEFNSSASRNSTIPTWYLIASTCAFAIAIIEGLLLYYLA